MTRTLPTNVPWHYKKYKHYLADFFLRQTKNPAAITATTKNKIKIG
jgi:hypothetical protein